MACRRWVDETAPSSTAEALPAIQHSQRWPRNASRSPGASSPPGPLWFDSLGSEHSTPVPRQCGPIHELHGRLGFTAVFVTHDQSEALALGDRLAIMRHGRIEQYDTPEHVFERPATEYVAAFIGMSNRLVCVRADNGWACDGQVLGGAPLQAAPFGGTVALRLRGEDVDIHPSDATVPTDRTTATATIVDSEYGGKTMDVVARLADTRIFARMASGDSGGFAASSRRRTSRLSFDDRPDVRGRRARTARRSRRELNQMSRQGRRCLAMTA